MVEFKSKEDMKKDMDELQNGMKSMFPEMRLFIGMEASETTNVGIAVYDNKEAADRAYSAASSWHRHATKADPSIER